MKMSRYLPGTPCWIDLGSPDLDVSRAFYTDLFGWTAEVSPDPAAGGYTTFHQGGSPVAGAGQLMSDSAPPAWTWYAATDDLDATAARVEGAGGKVMVPPMDVLGIGRMAVFMDTTGAPFSAWQGGSFPGAGIVNEPSTFCWNELMVREADAAADFYGRALGWTTQASDQPGVAYTEFKCGDRSVAGMMPMTSDRYPDDLPSHWMVYLAVADVDETAERIGQLGGVISIEPTGSPAGRFAVAGDPCGAVFGIVTLT
ncbi:VOC family protein [Rugosimonospora acidiphila]|uniref:VOC family protein n=1 Tax=Rugosimonospora acidiphila TaxID=556531 RepID=A0ABP9RI85_9ACTN